MISRISFLNALVESLIEEPFYASITADFSTNELRRREALKHYFDYSMQEGARIGRCIFTAEQGLGVATWLLPVAPAIQAKERAAKAEYLARVLGNTGNENYHRIIKFMAPLAQKVVPDDAWYLSIVGVAPSAQGRGVGMRLLEPTIAEADQAVVPCYLETFTPRNQKFYERLGFRSVASHFEPTTRAKYVVMLRDARP